MGQAYWIEEGDPLVSAKAWLDCASRYLNSSWRSTIKGDQLNTTPAIREDKNLQLLVAMFALVNDITKPDKIADLWTLLEIAGELGVTQGAREALAIIRGPKREQEAQEAAVRG